MSPSSGLWHGVVRCTGNMVLGEHTTSSAWQNFCRDDVCGIFFQNLVFTSETTRCNDPEGHCISLPPPFENPKPHIERLVASLDMGNTVVPRTYCRVFMILNTGQRHSLIFCGKCASPAGNNVRIICVVWIDQQEYALTFYSLAVYVPRGLRFRNSTWCTHCVCVFWTDLKTNSNLLLIHH
jgi:hypothetical protein